MRWTICLCIISICYSLGATRAGAMGQEDAQLVIIVRDKAGVALPGVTVALTYDGDDERVSVGQKITDGRGRVVFTDLAYGTYSISFSGTTPDGRPILPAERQNLGLLEDGAGVSGGFGIRIVAPQITQLFLLATVSGEVHAVPMFDLALAPDLPPTPIDPLLELSKPTPTTFAAPQAPLASAQRRSPALNTTELTLTSVCLGSLALLVALATLGWLRSRHQRREEQHG